jgi:hypothetical protein
MKSDHIFPATRGQFRRYPQGYHQIEVIESLLPGFKRDFLIVQIVAKKV